MALNERLEPENQRGGVIQEHEPGPDELCTAEMISIPIVP